MVMTKRVAELRQQSLEAEPSISAERAAIITEFYQQDHGLISGPMLRALAFKHLMEQRTICINPGELIVGEKGPLAKASPTFPELCCHSLEDLEILNDRQKIPFSVSEETRETYQNVIIPFWEGKSMRDLIFREMTDEWKSAYEAGIFTEFMEQRAPGHTVLDDKIYKKGFIDFKVAIQNNLDQLDYLNDDFAYAKQEELRAMLVCADAIISFAERHAELAEELAAQETNPQRKTELKRIAEVCRRVPAYAPRDFQEALQAYWFVHLGVTSELNTWDAFNPGHLDQHLYPFYQSGLENGTLNRELAEELLQCFWIKFNNQPAPPKVGVTAEESGTYTDFAQINTGGLLADGSNGVNEVTYLILDVIEEMRLLQPSSSIQVSKKNPNRFIKRAAKIIRTGFGQPSVFNSDLIVQELVRQGKSVKDARAGGSSGCVEVGAFGKENYNLTGYFNIPKILELTLYNGKDPRTGKQIGPQTGEVHNFRSYEELFTAFKQQLDYFIEIKVRGNQVIERLFAAYMPCPFLSILINDCISTGKDYHNGGARYNTSYIQGVGLGSITDALASIQYHIYDQKTLSMSQLLEILEEDFVGHEGLRQLLLNKTPKYGNDNDYADQIMTEVFEAYYQAIEGRKNTKGGNYHINLLPTTVHVYFGSVIGAMPDGRKAGLPLSEGISPVQGMDRHGPTAVLRSAAKMDHARTGGTLLNQKFTPQILDSDEDLDKLVQLIRSYFRLDGHHIQFNVIEAATLRKAKENPAEYRDLIVRVAGYSDYFCDLSEALQDEIIARTEHMTL
jgi:pyruvate formate-lyase/glycerol dehydratase family glycyl radical enzyme